MTYQRDIIKEIKTIPPEYLPNLLQMIRDFRETLHLKPAAESFRQGWQEVLRGETHPIEELWEGVNTDKSKYPLRGIPMTYIDPTEPVAVDDWEALK